MRRGWAVDVLLGVVGEGRKIFARLGFLKILCDARTLHYYVSA